MAKRFASVEAEASRIHAEQSGSRIVKALMNGSGLHVLVTDGKTILEIAGGVTALSVAQPENRGE